MGTGHIFISIIDLPKSEYYFTTRVTFWQVFFNFLSVFFVAIDTAIEDVISRAVTKIREKIEKTMMSFGALLCPQVTCA